MAAVVDAAALLFSGGAIAGEGAVGDRQRAVIIVIDAAALRGAVVEESAVDNRHRAVVVDATAVDGGAIFGDRGALHRQRAQGTYPAPLGAATGRDGEKSQGERGACIHAENSRRLPATHNDAWDGRDLQALR